MVRFFKLSFEKFIIYLLVFLLFASALFVYIEKRREFDRLYSLENSGYRYTSKVFSADKKSGLAVALDYYEKICGSSDYNLVDSYYNKVNFNSHAFHYSDTYLYCKDDSMHENSATSIDFSNYHLVQRFPGYPSSQAILNFCSLDKAIVVNNNMEPLNPEKDITSVRRVGYLYCLDSD